MPRHMSASKLRRVHKGPTKVAKSLTRKRSTLSNDSKSLSRSSRKPKLHSGVNAARRIKKPTKTKSAVFHGKSGTQIKAKKRKPTIKPTKRTKLR